MGPVSDEKLMAYADGELMPGERKALEADLAGNAELRARLEPFTLTRSRLSTVFEHRLHDPIPDRLIAAITHPRRLMPLMSVPRQPTLREKARHALDTIAAVVFPGGQAPAFAASVVALVAVGVAAGWVAGRSSSPGQPASSAFVESASSGLVASGPLARALEDNPSHTPSAAGPTGATVVPVLSFRTHDAGVCREYRVRSGRSDPDFAGLACRTPDGVWHVALHVEAPKPPRSNPQSYETAGEQNVPAVDALIDKMIEGSSLGTDEEAASLKDGWKIPAASAKP